MNMMGIGDVNRYLMRVLPGLNAYPPQSRDRIRQQVTTALQAFPTLSYKVGKKERARKREPLYSGVGWGVWILDLMSQLDCIALYYTTCHDIGSIFLSLALSLQLSRFSPDGRGAVNSGPTTLLELTGTIMINFRGATYNILISIRLPANFPFTQPVCYVTEVGDIKVKNNHPQVDQTGERERRAVADRSIDPRMDGYMDL